MQLRESGEMYLETILVLSHRLNSVRSIDIAHELNFSKPSVSNAVKSLSQGGYIQVDKDGYITLTPSGLEIAKKIYERHIVITKCLVALGVDPQAAAEDACKMEHVISDNTFTALKQHYELHSM